MPALPKIPPPRKLDHVWFEATGGHAHAVRILRRHLTPLRSVRVLAGLLRRQVLTDPFASVGPIPAGDVAEWLTRRQLGPVILLDETLREDLGLSPDEARPILADLIAEVGTQLLARRFPRIDPAAWASADAPARESIARGVFARLGNVFQADVRTSDQDMAIDVRRCRFAELCRQLDKGHLAPLFCAADERFFATTETSVTFERTQTLASGGSHCDFRFQIRNPTD
jgi:hypothetical protein